MDLAFQSLELILNLPVVTGDLELKLTPSPGICILLKFKEVVPVRGRGFTSALGIISPEVRE